MAVKKDGKLRYTNEQLEAAKAVGALEYATAQGYNLVKSGTSYRLREHDSMVFTAEGRWHWNSRDQHGGAIEFIMHYEGRTDVEAVLLLAGALLDDTKQSFQAPYRAQRPQAEQAPKEFTLPKKCDTSRRVYQYMTETRKLHPELVKRLLVDGKLYESLPHHNAVFVMENNEHAAVGAFMRGTNTHSQKRFVGLAPNSDKTTGYFCFGGGNQTHTAYFCEGAIDAASLATLLIESGHPIRKILDQRYFVASCGAGLHNLEAFIQAHPNVRKVFTCQDRDAAGHTQAAKIAEMLEQYGVEAVRREPVEDVKDFNEQLQAFYHRAHERRQQADQGNNRSAEPEAEAEICADISLP